MALQWAPSRQCLPDEARARMRAARQPARRARGLATGAPWVGLSGVRDPRACLCVTLSPPTAPSRAAPCVAAQVEDHPEQWFQVGGVSCACVVCRERRHHAVWSAGFTWRCTTAGLRPRVAAAVPAGPTHSCRGGAVAGPGPSTDAVWPGFLPRSHRPWSGRLGRWPRRMRARTKEGARARAGLEEARVSGRAAAERLRRPPAAGVAPAGDGVLLTDVGRPFADRVWQWSIVAVGQGHG
jgi:hypothetical protein